MRNDKSVAKQLYATGMSLREVSESLEIPLTTIKSWSASEGWKEERQKIDKFNVRINAIIDAHLSHMEKSMKLLNDESSKASREDVTILKDLLAMRDNFSVPFAQKVAILKEVVEYAKAKRSQGEAQTVAEIAQGWTSETYDELEE